jgi:1-pyrroline-5-carboxylate dehydrogenase
MMGNTCCGSRPQTAMLGAYYTMKLLEAAGLPPGVINFVPGDSGDGERQGRDEFIADLGGIHFTGSTASSSSCGNTWACNIRNYKSYPRLVGETGGKDFIMVHPSADPQEVAVAMVRGAYEYQGQKCSAASAASTCRSPCGPSVRDRAVAMMPTSRWATRATSATS